MTIEVNIDILLNKTHKTHKTDKLNYKTLLVTAYISTGKAAKICGVTSDTVLKWIKKGDIEVKRTAGGHFRVNTDSLKPYIITQKDLDRNNSYIPGKITYCWEYLNKEEQVVEGCRTCMVFKSKAEKCYLLAGAGEKIGFEGVFCKSSCSECEYFKFINKLNSNVLIITNDDLLKGSISDRISREINLEFACCGYETAQVISEFQPDFIVIDESMDDDKNKEISRHLVKDRRIHGAQIILGTKGDTDMEYYKNCICASIDLPFEAEELENCINELRLKIMGIKS